MAKDARTQARKKNVVWIILSVILMAAVVAIGIQLYGKGKELRETRTTLMTTQEMLNSSEANLASTRNELAIIKDTLNSTKSELVATKEALDSTENELAVTKKALTSTENELAVTKETLTSTENELAVTKETLTSTENELATAKEKLATMESELVTARAAYSATGKENADYTEIEFEKALNDGKDLVGKTVCFKVKEVKPTSAFGFNLWSGKHLNFIAPAPFEVDEGDELTVRVDSVQSFLGSWIIYFEFND